MTEPKSTMAAQPAPATSGVRDALLLVTMAILSGALGAGLHLLAEVPVQMAALAGVSCLSMLVAGHAMVRRASTAAALDAEIAALRAEIAGLRSARPAGSRPSIASHATAPAPEGPPLPARFRAPVAAPPPAERRPGLLVAPSLSAAPPRWPHGDGPVPDRVATVGPASHGPAERQPAETEIAGPPAPLDWSIRPGTHREPTGMVGSLSDRSTPSGPLPLMAPLAAEPSATREVPVDATRRAMPSVEAASPAPAQPAQVEVAVAATPAPLSQPDGLANLEAAAAPRAMARPDAAGWPQATPNVPTSPLDLETMQSLIEQLAVQLKPHDEVAAAAPAEAAEARAAVAVAREIIARPAPPPLRAPFAAVNARAAAGSPPGTRNNPDAAPFGHLALIAEAVEANRMDVYLDPILGLDDRKARHFELSVRLITATGAGLGEEELHRAAAGTGLLARIDASKLASAAGVIKRLQTRGSGASLFSAVAGESLADDNFAGAFAEILAAEEGSGTRLVLTFAQAEARNFTAAHWRAITDMAAIGLKFAVTDVTDLDMDFEVLTRNGFDFIKLDAPVFLEGLPAPGGHIPAADICRHLSGLGLGLIVGGIVAERDLARIMGFGAILGQGTLFGGPRSVELERERRAA